MIEIHRLLQPLWPCESCENFRESGQTPQWYRNFFESDGVRYSHSIDPRTGRPVAHGLASVTVLAPTCAEADAWATALTILGEEQGLLLAEQLNLAVYMLVNVDDSFKVISSTAFAPYLNQSDSLPTLGKLF